MKGREVHIMSFNAEKLLLLSADMECFMHRNDRLGAMVESVCEDELFEDELEYVAAATAVPSFEVFMRQFQDRKRHRSD